MKWNDVRTRGVVLWLALGVLSIQGSSLVPSAWAEDDPEPAPPVVAEPAAAVWPDGAAVATITTHVNVRVGPRRDNHPVVQLDAGDVVVIVERVPEWFGVLIPSGFQVALSAKYAERVGADAVRVDADRLNLRVSPPVDGQSFPGAFRDHPERGALLPFVRTEGEWLWVLAPETIRAYVSAEFVRELGPPADHPDLIELGRAKRRAQIDALVESRHREIAAEQTTALRDAIAEAQERLYRIRLEGGFDRTPVVVVADALAEAIASNPEADRSTCLLARTLHADFEAEIEVRLARKDAEVAALRGLVPEPERPLTEKLEEVVVVGRVRWEAAPKWKNGGAFILWIDEQPAFVLRLTTGVKHPYPDLAGSADGTPRTIVARQPGERVFGLPALDVLEIRE